MLPPPPVILNLCLEQSPCYCQIKRMQNTLPKFINPNQSAYVKGYYIGKNNRLIQDVIFLTKCFNMPGTVIFLDCKKAFDTVNWNYPLYLLRLFNFGPDIQRSVGVTYHNVSSLVLNNACGSPFFNCIKVFGKDASYQAFFL